PNAQQTRGAYRSLRKCSATQGRQPNRCFINRFSRQECRRQDLIHRVPPSLWRKSAAVTSLSLRQLLDDGARSGVTKVIVSFLSFAAAVLDASRGGGFYSGRPDPARSIGRVGQF